MQCPRQSDDPLSAALFATLTRLMKSSQQEAMQIAAEYDFTLSQLRILFTLDHSPEPISVGELSAAIHLSLAATGRAVDALHRNELVSREEDPTDRRVKRIALTDRGLDAVQRIAQARIDAIERFVSALSNEERSRLASVVDVLGDLTEAHLPAPLPRTPSTTTRSEPAV